MPRCLREADEIPDDQEISRELHLLDRPDFAIQPLGVLREIVLQPALRRQRLQPRAPLLESLPRDVFEIAVGRVCSGGTPNFGNGSCTGRSFIWQRCAMSQVRSSACSTSPNSAIISSRDLEIERGLLEAHAIRIRHGLAGLDAQHDFVRARVVLAQIMRIVGRHQRNAGVGRQPIDQRQHARVRLEAVILQFEEEILRPEQIGVFVRQRRASS